jgi:hypothetical protein
MIPSLIAFGLVFGYWWKSTLAVAAIGWPIVLFASGIYSNGVGLPNPLVFAAGSAAIALANAGVGVALNRGGAALLRGRQRRRERESAAEA